MIDIKNATIDTYDDLFTLCIQNLRINDGIWNLVGENGSGKSTLLSFLINCTKNNKHHFIVNDDAQIHISESLLWLDKFIKVPLYLYEVDLYQFLMKVNKKDIDVDYTSLYHDKTLGMYSNGELCYVVTKIICMLEPKILLIDEYIDDLEIEYISNLFVKFEELKKLGSLIIIVGRNKHMTKYLNNMISIVDGYVNIDVL